MQKQELSTDPDTRFAFEHLRAIAESTRKMVAQKRVKNASQFVLAIEVLRLIHITPEDIATVLGQPPLKVRKWSMYESLPEPSRYQEYAEKAYALLAKKGIRFAGARLHSTTGEPMPEPVP